MFGECAVSRVPAAVRLAICSLLTCGLLLLSSIPLHAQQVSASTDDPSLDGAAFSAATNVPAQSVSGADGSAAVAEAPAPSGDSDAVVDSSPPADPSATTAVSTSTDGDSAAGESSSAAVPADPQDQGAPQSAPGEVGPVVNHQIADEHFFTDFALDYLHDEIRIWTGPFERHNYDSHTSIHYGLPFVIISGVLIGTDKYTAKWLPGERSGLDRFGTVYSDVFSPYANAGYAATWYLVGRATHNEHTREAGFLSLLAIANAETIGGVLKIATWRTRPSGPDTALAGFWHGGFSSSSGGLSMPSGHTMAAFAMATVLSREYQTHHRFLVPIIAYAMASTVGFARLSAHEHWYSDVFVGSSLGFLIGRYDYINHHDTDLPGAIPVRHTPRPIKLAKLKPTFEAGPQGLGLYWYP